MLLVMISLGLERRKPKKNVGRNSVRENILVLNEPYLRLNVNSISLKGNRGVPVVAQWLTNPTRNLEVPCPCSVG